jgi:hypothetical protein
LSTKHLHARWQRLVPAGALGFAAPQVPVQTHELQVAKVEVAYLLVLCSFLIDKCNARLSLMREMIMLVHAIAHALS